MRCERNGNGVMDAKMLNVQCAAFANNGRLVRAHNHRSIHFFSPIKWLYTRRARTCILNLRPGKGQSASWGAILYFVYRGGWTCNDRASDISAGTFFCNGNFMRCACQRWCFSPYFTMPLCMACKSPSGITPLPRASRGATGWAWNILCALSPRTILRLWSGTRSPSICMACWCSPRPSCSR